MHEYYDAYDDDDDLWEFIRDMASPTDGDDLTDEEMVALMDNLPEGDDG